MTCAQHQNINVVNIDLTPQLMDYICHNLLHKIFIIYGCCIYIVSKSLGHCTLIITLKTLQYFPFVMFHLLIMN